MSRITGPKQGDEEEFGIRIPSGIFIGGSIQITWASGEIATSQIDWGLTPEVDRTTNETHTGTNMVKYHTVQYPNVYIGAHHYFRVRSRNAEGEIRQSGIMSVLIPERFALVASGLNTEPQKLEVKQVEMSEYENKDFLKTDSHESEKESLLAETGLEPSMKTTQTSTHDSDGDTAIGTNYNITVE